jgi:hypothetical protein
VEVKRASIHFPSSCRPPAMNLPLDSRARSLNVSLPPKSTRATPPVPKDVSSVPLLL